MEKAILPLYFGMDEYRWVKMGILNRLWVINCQRDSKIYLPSQQAFPKLNLMRCWADLYAAEVRTKPPTMRI
ncbi:hypothetical protein D3C87_1660050 [compost metagenome]